MKDATPFHKYFVNQYALLNYGRVMKVEKLRKDLRQWAAANIGADWASHCVIRKVHIVDGWK